MNVSGARDGACCSGKQQNIFQYNGNQYTPFNTAQHCAAHKNRTSEEFKTEPPHTDGTRVRGAPRASSVASTVRPSLNRKQLLYRGMSVITSCPVRLNKQLQISK